MPHGSVRLYHWKVLVDYFQLHWNKFFSKPLPPGSSWKNGMIGHLHTLLSAEKIVNGKEKQAGSVYTLLNIGYYGVINCSELPMSQHRVRPTIAFKVYPTGTLVPITEASDVPLETDVKIIKNNSNKNRRKEIDSIDFDRQNPATLESVKISRLSVLTNACLVISADGLCVTSGKGYRTAKASHGCFSGTWYYEVSISEFDFKTHIRVGWAQGLSDLHSPVGFDEFGYALGDVTGNVFHTGRPLATFSSFPIDDKVVIGLLIHLPLPSNDELDYDKEKLEEFQTLFPPRRLSDSYLIKNKLLSGSYLEFFLNGTSIGRCGKEFGLYRGKYYPAVSVYNGTISVNFGESSFVTDFSRDCRTIFPISKLSGLAEPFDFETSQFNESSNTNKL